MNQYLLFLVLGLGTGAVYAGLSLGIVIGYRGSGIINFSQGAIMTYVAYTFAELRTSGRLLVLFFPFVDLTRNQSPMGFWPAIVLALAIAIIIGIAMHYCVFDRLRDAPALSKIVASLGILAVLQSTIGIRFAETPLSVPNILPTTPIDMLGSAVTANQFWLAGITVVVAFALYLTYRFTRFGLRTRASAENEVGAMVLGYSPSRTGAANWVIAVIISSLLGIFAAPITQLTPTNFTLFIIPALGAALLAKFDSLLVTVVASMILGMIDSLLILAVTRLSWLPQSGMRELVPFVVVAAAVIFRGSKLPTRGAKAEIRLPSVSTVVRRPAYGFAGVAIALVGILCLPGNWRGTLITTLIGIVLALSFVTLTGFLGQISLCQLTTAGLAGFFLMRLTSSIHIPFPLGPLIAIAASTVIGVLVGLPALRVRGVNLAIITLAYASAVDGLVFESNSLNPDNGSRIAAEPSIFGFKFGPLNPLHIGTSGLPSVGFGLFVLLVVIVATWAVSNLQRSETGRRMLSVRGDESAAAMIGLSVVRTKLLGMAISAALASIAGVLLVYQNAGIVSEPQFAPLMSVTVLTVAYLGGLTSIGGATAAGLLAAGGVFFYILTELFGVNGWTPLIVGFGLIITVILNPAGVADGLGKGLRSLRRRAFKSQSQQRDDGGNVGPSLRRSGDPTGNEAPLAAVIGTGTDPAVLTADL